MLVLGLSSVFTQTDTHGHNAMSLAQLSTSSLIYRDKQKSVLIKEVPLERSCTQEGCSRTGEELFAVCVATERWDVHTHTHKETHIHYANYELCTGGKLSREVTVKGDSYAGDSWFSL